ncbi:hypothetical protein KVR01_012984 [Diaporthe batatas]|uniref:uncharacterized protein n=1 Tax=Diaporthe batatas TaxID=748121 RepID=UPI001D04391E|nr:uncharacterized protein KVR01_012984 [Diaporthe batatas]KAG8157276.1 hypothetical protein KVR01_012984 [Diaporthe batatas]
MDTRSVVRSRRRSTRLTGHSPQDQPARPPTKRKKRNPGHRTSGHSSSSESRESSCPGADASPKQASSSPDSHPKPQEDKTAKATTAEATEDEDDNVVPPLLPNPPLSQDNVAVFHRAETEPITAPRNKSVDTPSENASKDHVSNKWVKTARGSIRLASDGPPEASKDGEIKKVGDVREGQSVRSAAVRRRSRRLASLSPDMVEETIEVQPLRSRRPTKVKAEATSPAPEGSDEGSDKPQEWKVELQDRSAKSSKKKDRSTQPTRHDELPSHGGNSAGPIEQEPDLPKNVAPIPELLADIERIVLSSPLAARDPDNDRTKVASSPTPTPAPAAEKQAQARMLTRSRALRSSSRLSGGAAGIGKGLDLDSVDSDSSQLDGAYDDSIRGQKKKNAQVKHGKASAVTPSQPRGTKRRAEQELSEPEGPAPAPITRLRRSQAGGRSNPEVDLSSSNPIEAATSRDAFAADDPSAEMAVGIGEFARRSGEPPNSVTLAHMISSDSLIQAENDDNIPTEARHGSQQPSGPPGRASGHHDPEEEAQGPAEEADNNNNNIRPTCDDCGRAPARYIVCARCLGAVYCGKYCQLWAWPAHRAHCEEAEGAVWEAADAQAAYLDDMWAAALRMLEGEADIAGGEVESLLLGEAVRHSAARRASMGQGRPRGFGGMVVGGSLQGLLAVPPDEDLMGGMRAMSILLARSALAGDE